MLEIYSGARNKNRDSRLYGFLCGVNLIEAAVLLL